MSRMKDKWYDIVEDHKMEAVDSIEDLHLLISSVLKNKGEVK